MKCSSTMSIPHTLTWLVFCFTFFPLVWLIMTCVTAPISTKLRISRMLDGDGNVLADLGVFGACSGVASSSGGMGIDCSRREVGYDVIFSVLTGDPTSIEATTSDESLYSTIALLGRDDTYPMILVPIATGFVGWSCILLAAAWLGGGRKWARTLDLSNMGFHWACTILTWIAFGFCIRVTQILRERASEVDFDNAEFSPFTLPLEVRYGNAVWLLLVSALLLLIGSVLYGFKTFWGPAKNEPSLSDKEKQYGGYSKRDLEMDGKRAPKQQGFVGMLGG